jgi:hypothetical protein
VRRAGVRRDDPRFEIGVWLEALVRVTRLACAIGVHTAGMTVEEGARRFEAGHALVRARRAVRGRGGPTFDPTPADYSRGQAGRS